jgi:hypothetical protein
MENYFVIFANPKRGKLDIIGSLAEWLGGGLQNRIRRFESARNLKSFFWWNFLKLKTLDIQGFFVFNVS